MIYFMKIILLIIAMLNLFIIVKSKFLIRILIIFLLKTLIYKMIALNKQLHNYIIETNLFLNYQHLMKIIKIK